MATNPETRITRQDLKFFPSERLTDNDDGGGMPLGTPIRGEANEIFTPISSIARVNGGFYQRLIYAGVLRADDEPLIGAFTAITKPPNDPTVSYLLFPATKFGELRSDILKRIEAYSVGTIESRMTLLSTQSQNSKIVQAYQRPGEPLPIVGDVYCLRQDKAGYPAHEQYIQVIKVDSEERTFTNPDTGKDFQRVVVKLEISSKLEADFIGADYPSEYYIDNPCKIRETHVADAAQYYGIKPLAEAIQRESMSLRVPSLMEKLVPTNQIETSMIDLTAGGQRQSLFDGAKPDNAGVITLNINKSHSVGTNTSLYFGNAITPNTVVISTSKGDVADKGGRLLINDTAIGTIDYANSQAVITDTTAWTGYIYSIEFRPAAAETRVADTKRIDIDINNQGYNHVFNIDPPPAPGSLIVSYRSQGRWYELRDDGTGALRGASEGHGSGNLNHITGSGDITTGELPDVGSAILLAWATQATYFNRSDVTPSPKMLLQLEQECDPSSIALVWNDGEEKTATSDASGSITGDWTGKYDPQTQQIRIDTGSNFNHPDGALDISVSYSTGDKTKLTFENLVKDGDGNITIELGDTPIKPNTLSLRYPLKVIDRVQPDGKDWIDPYSRLTDDGNGNLINANNETVGTVDYTARTLNFNPDVTVNVPVAQYKSGTYNKLFAPTAGNSYHGYRVVSFIYLSGYEYQDVTATIKQSATVDVSFYDTNPQNTVFENLSTGNIEIDLLPRHAEVIVPSSVNVTWQRNTYFDKLGSVFTDLDATTGSATLAGTIDYADGKMLINNWQWTDGTAPTVTSLVTSITGNPVDSVTFRTPSSPIRPSSLQVRATAIDGTKINVIANNDGSLESDYTDGFVDAEYGVVDIRFGQYVNAAGNENEDWYSQDAIENGKIWRPLMVLAETITFNAVAYSYLPVDSKVVKIDTVRLPQDGRIPIFRRGDTILIGNRQIDDIGSAHTGGQTVQLSRSDVDRICVTDADNKPVNAELWNYDLENGTITWTTPLDLSSYKMPLSVMHAQEQRNRIIQADIDGTLTLQFPTNRDYPIENTYVSSVMIGGDLRVRHSIPFTQRNWNGEWRDEPNGDQLLNKLNLKDYPMVLTDDGAIKERWMIKFKSSSQFELYGETLGYVGKYDTLIDLAPINPATSKPYFAIPHEAFGGTDAPWQPQDVIRFDTWGTLMGVHVLCAVQPSSTTPEGEDGFTMTIFGDTTEI